jgi:citrate lyase subunit beta/citryl-CoA lyase
MLYVPATRPEWVTKAIAAGPEAVILDLEDAVGPNEKATAPALVPQEIETLRAHCVFAFLRPNQMTAGGIEDILTCVRPGLTGIILPKASVKAVQTAHDVLSFAEGKAGLRHGEVSIIALPETAEGVRNGYDIAKASTRVRGLLGGVGVLEGDVAWTCGFRPTFEGREQLYFQSKIILDSRAAGATYPIAGVFSPRIDDLTSLETFVLRAKELGFTGAAVIHPSHVRIVNAVFQPSEQDVAHYEGLIAALEDGHRRGSGAVRYKGAMVDLALLPIARDIVAQAARRKTRV